MRIIFPSSILSTDSFFDLQFCTEIKTLSQKVIKGGLLFQARKRAHQIIDQLFTCRRMSAVWEQRLQFANKDGRSTATAVADAGHPHLTGIQLHDQPGNDPRA